MNEIIRFDHVYKEYRLGLIGGGTLQGDIKSAIAKWRGKEDPNSKIGAKTYNSNEKFLALSDINLSVNSGDTLGIIGHNGAGKSTLLKLLSRVTAPTEGNIYLDGTISSMLEVGTGFHPELTGKENIYLNGAILGMSRKEIASKLDQIIEFSECAKFIDTPVKRYSSGMYVKLAFSVSAHLDSDILVMDEVLAVGDLKFQQKCLNKMCNVANYDGRTVLYVSHNMNTIRQLCSKCIVLDHGKLIFQGDTEEAISIYMDAFDVSFTNYIDFTKMKHMPYCSKRVVFENATVDADSNIFSEKESFNVKYNVTSKENLDNVKLMMVLFYRDGTRVGITESNGFHLNKGENIINAKFPLNNLADGDYYLEIIIQQRNEFGTFEKYDSITEIFPFKINNDTVFGMKGIEWKPNWYGHILLSPLEVENRD